MSDLRNLKSSCLLFYADNLAWPSEGDIEELDNYLDRPIISSAVYEEVIIGSEYKDESGGSACNIGVRLRPEGNGNEGVRKALEDMTLSAGLLRAPDSSEQYQKDSMTIFMRMR